MKKFLNLIRTEWVLMLLMSAIPGLAQPNESPGLQEAVAGAHVIIVGQVRQVQPGTPENPFANSEAVVEITERLKGDTATTITLRYPGPVQERPGRGSGSSQALRPFVLTPGERRLFLLEGGAPYHLAHFQYGILPLTLLSAVRTTLQAMSLQISLAPLVTHVRQGGLLVVRIALSNAGARTLELRLPRQQLEACRFTSWAMSAGLPTSPVRIRQRTDDPSGYVPVRLEPGATLQWQERLQILPLTRLREQKTAAIAVSLYWLPLDHDTPQGLASAPITVTITP